MRILLPVLETIRCKMLIRLTFTKHSEQIGCCTEEALYLMDIYLILIKVSGSVPTSPNLFCHIGSLSSEKSTTLRTMVVPTL
jgi:hypothetical protein